MQCVDENGELRWAYIADPCVSGLRLKNRCEPNNISFENSTVGEEYLPMISDWFRHSETKLVHQYIRYINLPATWKKIMAEAVITMFMSISNVFVKLFLEKPLYMKTTTAHLKHITAKKQLQVLKAVTNT